MNTHKKTDLNNQMYNFERFNYYKSMLKKYVNSLIRIKNIDKRIEKLLEIFDIYQEEFEEISDELSLCYYTDNFKYKKLFEVIENSLVKLSEEIIDIDKMDELVDYNDREIYKYKKSIKRKNKLDFSGDFNKEMNSYFDIKDELDYYLIELKNIINDGKTSDKKRALAIRECFVIEFHIYFIFDEVINKLQNDYLKGDFNDVEAIKFIEQRLESIYSRVNVKSKKFKLLKFLVSA